MAYVGLISNDHPGFFAGMFLFILRIISVPFFICVGFKNYLYDRNILKTVKLPQKVISIGNLTMGGTGKTPVVKYLAEKIRDMGRKAAVICRSYSGSEKEAWVSSGERILIREIDRAGDEPLMLARVLRGIPVGVSTDRATLAKTKSDVDVFLLDDAFQHRKFHRDMDIVLIDAAADIENRFLIPRGVFREDISSLGRADVVVLTRSGMVSGEKLDKIISIIKKVNPCIEVLMGRENISSITGAGDGKACLPKDFEVKSGFVFTAIGNPGVFRKSLQDIGIEIVDSYFFADHYFFKEDDLSRLAESGDYFITRKDAVKLEKIIGRFDELRFWIVDIELSLYDENGRIVIWPKKLEQLLSLNIQQ